MQQIITQSLTPNLQRLPKLPKTLTTKEVQLLQQSVNANITKKVQSSILKILLAEAYRKVGSEKFSRQVSDLGFQYLQNTPLMNEARFRICTIILDSFDDTKFDLVKFHVNQFDQKIDQATPLDKVRFVLIKSGMEALKQSYYKAALGYYYASKQDALAKEDQQKVQFIEKAILLCFLAEKNKQLHQLICQLYTNAYAKKSQLYPLLIKLYSQDMIDVTNIQTLKNLLPQKFDKQDSNKISPLSRAIFRHNMLPIKQSFQTISLETLSKFTNIKIEQLQLLIETTYGDHSDELEIDQLCGVLRIRADPLYSQGLIKGLFERMEELITRTQTRGSPVGNA